jgi:AraC-like DNA-binding protein
LPIGGASERLLRYAFLERFGVSPKAYLLAVRLNGVRKELRAADPVCTVIDVANIWGFWHMGQFAADYRRLFGNFPSKRLGVLPTGLFENLMMIERNSPTPKISKSLGFFKLISWRHG